MNELTQFRVRHSSRFSIDDQNLFYIGMLQAFEQDTFSGAARIAEGTLFTYFKTKDELVNALYREIKVELADAMMSGLHNLPLTRK
jgi:hypothetical protein